MSSLRSLNGVRRSLQCHRANYYPISHLRLSTFSRRPFSLSTSLKSQAGTAHRPTQRESSSASISSKSPKQQQLSTTPSSQPKAPDNFDTLQHDLLQNSSPYDILSTAHKGWRNARQPGITDHSLNDSTTGLIRDQPFPGLHGQPSYPIWPQKELDESTIVKSSETSEAVSNEDVWANTVREMDKNRNLSSRFGCFLNVDGAKNGNVAVRLRQLASLASSNRIAYTASRQRFHERPGLKRKRLRRERWRRRFKVTFKKICARVTHLTKQGW
jgi:small subunit ribosomal protein MRP21